MKLTRFQVGFKYYFANAHKMGFYGAFSVASLLQAVSSTILHFLQIANSDKPIALYSLDMILAVGFRVRSPRGTQFRKGFYLHKKVILKVKSLTHIGVWMRLAAGGSAKLSAL